LGCDPISLRHVLDVRVLQIHNRYRHAGGEDLVVSAEASMLRRAGIEVLTEHADNEGAGAGLLGLAWSSSWSREWRRRVYAICTEWKPDIAHVHNFWMRISPSVHRACRDAGVATVQTLHNYRLMCANAALFREGNLCTDCLTGGTWRGVVRRCYHGSFPASVLVTRMIESNRLRGTWYKHVNAFIALSDHQRSLFTSSGCLPEDVVHVKPNFLDDPGPPDSMPSASKTVVFIGRLTLEKGPAWLIDAWKQSLGRHAARLLIIGDGPDGAVLRRMAAEGSCDPRIDFAGFCDPATTLAHLTRARFCAVPSLWYEPFGRVAVEAFACGKPVIASDTSGLGELVEHGKTGLKVPLSDTNAFALAIEQLATNDALVDQMGRAARASYLSRFTPDANINLLLRIYESAIQRAVNSRSRPR
jgi:glycosyltransferase involved in cell wall biosynthesis